MGAKNRVIAGDYVGKAVDPSFNGPVIKTGVGEKIHLNHSTVESYELVTDEHRKSAKSGAARGLVGGVLLGPVGLLAGGMSAKSKGIYQVALQFKDGKRSLVEVDDRIYKAIVQACF